jgi:hypothetical protein
MERRKVRWVGVIAVLVAAGYGAYEWLGTTPQPTAVTPPQHEDRGGTLPTAATWEELARTNPVALLDTALTQYQRTIKGFTATLEKQERIDGKLHEPEVIALAVQGDVPDSPGARPNVKVRMVWEEKGARRVMGSALRATLYAEGSNDNRIWTWRPGAPLKKEHSIDPKESNARGASRYCIRDTGLYQVMLRTHAAWAQHQKAGDFHFEYDGLKPVEKLGGRPCHVIRRTCTQPEADPFALDEVAPTDPQVLEKDGFTEVTICVDAERWIQVGTELRKGADLIGAYYYRDLGLNPTFAPDTFTTTAIKAATKK